MIDVDGDELVVSSPHAGSGFDGRVRTGDRVEIVGDRVLIVGRRDHDEINVGGMKALGRPGARDAAVAPPPRSTGHASTPAARRSSGSLVAARRGRRTLERALSPTPRWAPFDPARVRGAAPIPPARRPSR